MDNKLFMRADEVAKELGVSQAYAYKLIKELNEELKAKGIVPVAVKAADIPTEKVERSL